MSTTTTTPMIRRREQLLARAPCSHGWMTSIVDAIAEDFETLRQHPSSTALFSSSSKAAPAPASSKKKKQQPQNAGQGEAPFQAELARLEAMHFAIGFDPALQPYNRDTTRALLFVASAYLAMPASASAEAIEFGLRLCSFFYFTQPQLRDFRLPAEIDRDELAEQEEDEDDIPFGELRNKGGQKKKKESNDDDDDDDADDDDVSTSSSDDDDDADKKKKKKSKKKKSSDKKGGKKKQKKEEEDEAEQDVAVPHRPVPVDRLAHVPITAETALYILNLCQKQQEADVVVGDDVASEQQQQQPLLSAEAIRHFALLKANNAFALTPKVRYHDVALWSIVMRSTMTTAQAKEQLERQQAEQPKKGPVAPLSSNKKNKNQQQQAAPAMRRPLLDAFAVAAFMQKLDKGTAVAAVNEDDDDDDAAAAASGSSSLVAAFAQYKALKEDIWKEEEEEEEGDTNNTSRGQDGAVQQKAQDEGKKGVGAIKMVADDDDDGYADW